MKNKMREVRSKKKEVRSMFQVSRIAFLVILLFTLVMISACGKTTEPTNPNIVEYKGFIFNYTSPFWVTEWRNGNNLYTIPLRFNPYQTENVTMTGEMWTPTKEVYITFDPEEEQLQYTALGAGELSQNLITALRVEPRPACTKNITEACAIRDIITCEDKDETLKIYLSQEEPTQITYTDNCIKVQGKEMELLRAIDKLLYTWYKIQTPEKSDLGLGTRDINTQKQGVGNITLP